MVTKEDDKTENVMDFLSKNVSVSEYLELSRVNFDRNKSIYGNEGLLTVLTDLFNWADTNSGYEYWYDVAHKGWPNDIKRSLKMVTKEEVDKARGDYDAAYDAALDAADDAWDVDYATAKAAAYEATKAATAAWRRYWELKEEFENV